MSNSRVMVVLAGLPVYEVFRRRKASIIPEQILQEASSRARVGYDHKNQSD